MEHFIQTEYGYCYYEIDDYPLIYNLYIKPSYRNKGKSKVLINFCIERIKELGWDEIYIKAEPFGDSIDKKIIERYYKSLGLKLIENCERIGEL